APGATPTPAPRRGPPAFVGGAFAPPLRIVLRTHLAIVTGSAAVDEPVTLRLYVEGRGGRSLLLPGTTLGTVRTGKPHRELVASGGAAARRRGARSRAPRRRRAELR